MPTEEQSRDRVLPAKFLTRQRNSTQKERRGIDRGALKI